MNIQGWMNAVQVIGVLANSVLWVPMCIFVI